MNTQKNKGFTLIEMMITIAIVAILSAIVFASVDYAKKRSRDSNRRIDIANINLAIQRYITINGHAPTIAGAYYASELKNWAVLQSELAPYLPLLPKDPCGINCYTTVNGKKKFFVYEYNSDPAHTKEYKINAENLELQDASYSVGASF